MNANRAMWMLAMVMAGAVVSARAEATGLRNTDVERLFERVRRGDLVELHGERTPELDQLFTAGNGKSIVSRNSR